MLQQQAHDRQLVAHGSEHQRRHVEMIIGAQVHQLRHGSHHCLDGVVVTVVRDVVDGRPSGVVVLEEIFHAAVAQPLGVEALEARSTSASFASQ